MKTCDSPFYIGFVYGSIRDTYQAHFGDRTKEEHAFKAKLRVRITNHDVFVRHLALPSDERSILVALSNGRIIQVDVPNLEHKASKKSVYELCASLTP
jgi:hypothetical protein